MKKKKRKRPMPQDLLYERFCSSCGWCGKRIGPDQGVFGVSARARPGLDLTHVEGQIIALHLVTFDRTILVGVAGRDSEAKRAGKDLSFMVCSRTCGEELRRAFDQERELLRKLL